MQNVFFMKDVIANGDKSVTIVILNAKQLKESIGFTINQYLANQKTVILVACIKESKNVMNYLIESTKKNFFIVDCCEKNAEENSNVISVNDPSNLTGIQVALEKINNKTTGKKVVIFDSINILAAYNKKGAFERFLHLFGNKMRLNENTAILFALKEYTDTETINASKELADKSYDYSENTIDSILAGE
ncbi:MAG: hypothetical protein NTY48_04595 [Candidatus Diapherotrites archaeon]|nr:hypothetical protein [Candidatus Diapherotrites archaeon]